MTKLKRCPFCGGEAVLFRRTVGSDERYANFTFSVRCMKCGVELPKSYKLQVAFAGGALIPDEDQREEAIKDWNRRSED